MRVRLGSRAVPFSLPRVVTETVFAVLVTGTLLSTASLTSQCPPPGGYGGGGGEGRSGVSGPSSPTGPAAPSPAGPATPSPAGPAVPTPGRDGPATGGPRAGIAGPATAGPAARGPTVGRRGPGLVFTHGETSKKMLQIDWDYPVYTPPAAAPAAPGQTVSTPRRQALPVDEALRAIAGTDGRPLLVLRECPHCQGTDMALLSREFANERTVLLTGWFHCAKLPPNVTQQDHPFHALFPEHTHLFLCLADGSSRLDFDGKQTQQQLWRVMGDLLRKSYRSDPNEAVKELLQLIAQFDVLDEKETRLLADLERALDTDQDGARSARVKELQKDLEQLGGQRKKLLERERELRAAQLAEPVATTPR